MPQWDILARLIILKYLLQEKKLISKYFEEISQDTQKFCFGIEDTLKGLEIELKRRPEPGSRDRHASAAQRARAEGAAAPLEVHTGGGLSSSRSRSSMTFNCLPSFGILTSTSSSSSESSSML